MQTATEVEIKLRLPSEEDYLKAENAFRAENTGTEVKYVQENVFFNGSGQELTNARAALRFRFFEENSEPKCVITLKESTKLQDGVAISKETEEDINPDEARALVSSPHGILTSKHEILQYVVKEYSCTGLVVLGSFRNTRKVFVVQGLKVELDETTFSFDRTWEIECETADPEKARTILENILRSAGAQFGDSKSTKFGNFIRGKID